MFLQLWLLSNQLKTDETVQACEVSKKTVIKVKKRAAELDISWPLEAYMTDKKLETILFPKTEKSVSTKRMPDFNHVREELLQNGVNKKASMDRVLSTIEAEITRTKEELSKIKKKYDFLSEKLLLLQEEKQKYEARQIMEAYKMCAVR